MNDRELDHLDAMSDMIGDGIDPEHDDEDLEELAQTVASAAAAYYGVTLRP